MGRPRDKQYWDQVTKEKDGRLKCKHCGHKFKGGAPRIRAHVDGIRGQGVTVCSANRDIGAHNSFASGSNGPQEAPNGMNIPVEGGLETVDAIIGGSMDHQTNPESTNLLEGSAPMHAVTRRDNNAFGSDENNQLNELLHNLSREEDDIREQLEWLESQGKKQKRQVDDWLNQVQELKNKADGRINSVLELPQCTDDYQCDQLLWNLELETHSIAMQQLIEEGRKYKEQRPLVLSNELVGKSFEENVKKIWELLGDDRVFIIGIHGMGGVGKTCLAAHMADEMKRRGTFNHVFWVTVSRDSNILKLQEDIAERIGAKLYGNDERTRAANLSLALETKGKSVLILDNVWKYIDLEKVGIPRRVNDFKLILTSRLKSVYRQMDCSPNNIIRMELLSHSEGLELFLLKLGHDGAPATIPCKILRIAKSIVSECHGLPLAITVMARTMKGDNSIHWWRDALNKLRNSEMGGEMKEEVFKVLKLSYDNLMDTCMQNCFLHCALYSSIDRANLIMKLVENEAIDGARSLEEIFNEGHTILDKLEDYSLLSEDLRMRHPIRNMACYIWKKTHRCMVKCHKRLTKIPHIKEWTADLEVVSLDDNRIEEIPADRSPCCPRLSTLILSNNRISSIPACFFTQMKTLAMLDLSRNGALTSLPESLSELSSLISLVLKDCDNLKYVPPLGELQALSRLEISGTSVEEIQGLEMLNNLQWLNLSDNRKLRLKPGTVLTGLTSLQHLDLWRAGSLDVKSEDVQGMTMLECFRGRFHDCENYNNYGKNMEERGYGPKTYHLLLENVSPKFLDDHDVRIAPGVDDCQILVFGDCEESAHWLPGDLAKLYIYGNTHWISLCGALSSNDPSSLKSIEIHGCRELKSLFCLFDSCSFCTNLTNLRSLALYDLKGLTVIWKEDVAARRQAPSWNGVFSHLRHFEIYQCHEIETLITPELSWQLQYLKTISAKCCHSVKEIFGTSSSYGASGIILLKLTKLQLEDLPQLKTVCKGVTMFTSSPELVILDCPNLEGALENSSFDDYVSSSV